MKKMRFMLTTMFLALLSLVLVSCGEKDTTVSYTQEQAMEKIATSVEATQVALTGSFEVALEANIDGLEVALTVKFKEDAASINVKVSGETLEFLMQESSIEANLTLVNNTIYLGLFIGSEDPLCLKATDLYDGFDDLLEEIVTYIADSDIFTILSLFSMMGIDIYGICYSMVADLTGLELISSVYYDASSIMPLVQQYNIDLSKYDEILAASGYSSMENLMNDPFWVPLIFEYIALEIVQIEMIGTVLPTIASSLTFSYTGGKTNNLVIASEILPAKVTLAFDATNVFKSVEVAVNDIGSFKLLLKTTGVTVSAPKNANLYSDSSSIPGFEITSIANLLNVLFSCLVDILN